MNRLTYKVNDTYYVKTARELYEDAYELVQSLGEYEDLEEELGISIPILFKVIFGNGIYVKAKYDEYNDYTFYRNDGCEYEVNIKAKRIEIYFTDNKMVCCEYHYFKDYGKTWWLKEDFKSE